MIFGLPGALPQNFKKSVQRYQEINICIASLLNNAKQLYADKTMCLYLLTNKA
jgi:hypothetical protein